jgi:hypothetical protein
LHHFIGILATVVDVAVWVKVGEAGVVMRRYASENLLSDTLYLLGDRNGQKGLPVKPLLDKSGVSVDYYGIFGQKKILYLVCWQSNNKLSERVWFAVLQV